MTPGEILFWTLGVATGWSIGVIGTNWAWMRLRRRKQREMLEALDELHTAIIPFSELGEVLDDAAMSRDWRPVESVN